MKNFLERFFKLNSYGTSVSKEFFAGFSAFLAASYVIFVNPSILSQTGMQKEALVTATILATVIATFLAGIIGKTPVIMAPGMGLNALFTYGLVLNKNIPWEQALGIVFISSVIFLILTLVNFQKKLLSYFPNSIKMGIGTGIGLFLSLIGLTNLGLITGNKATLVQLGHITPTIVIAIIGFLFTLGLMIYHIKGSIVMGIIFTTIISIICGYSKMPSHFIALPPSISPIFMHLDIIHAFNIAFFAPIFTFMFVDLFDSLSTVSTMVEHIHFRDVKDANSKISNTLKIDSLASTIGSILGVSTTTVYSESLIGIADGGKTGLTAVFTSLFFAATLFFSPLITVVPLYATAPALLMVGIMLAQNLKNIDLSNLKESTPAFLSAFMVPFTYSISTGLAFGFLSYIAIEIMTGKIFKIHWVIWLVGVLCTLNLIMQ